MSAKVVEKPKGSGKWGVRICKNGLEKYQRTETKAEAERLAKLINTQLARVDLGLAPTPQKALPTFAKYAEIWLATYIKPPMRSHGTHVKYKGLLDKYLIPALGNKTLESFRRTTIRDALLKIYHSDGKPSQSLIENMIAVLSGVFGMAFDSELLPVNPVQNIGRSLRLPKEQKKEFEPFTAEESELVLETIEQNYPLYYPLFLILFTTGMRLGEACGLQWGDVSLVSKQIKVQRTATNQRVYDTTKTHAARQVDMSDGLTLLLKTMKLDADREEQETGVERLYCCHKNGQLFVHTTLRRALTASLSKAGLNNRRIHDIRHTYASRLLSKGANIVYVSRQLGHKNIQMTVDIYTHWIPSGEGRPANMLDRTKKKVV